MGSKVRWRRRSWMTEWRKPQLRIRLVHVAAAYRFLAPVHQNCLPSAPPRMTHLFACHARHWSPPCADSCACIFYKNFAPRKAADTTTRTSTRPVIYWTYLCMELAEPKGKPPVHFRLSGADSVTGGRSRCGVRIRTGRELPESWLLR